jgi:hypothetical protein
MIAGILVAAGPLLAGVRKSAAAVRAARESVRSMRTPGAVHGTWTPGILGIAMSTRWENVVNLARDVDAVLASGRTPDITIVARLARAVIDFQRELYGSGSPGIRTAQKASGL